MAAKTVKERVIEVISQQLGIKSEDIKPEHHLIDDLKADSLDVVELVMEVEKEFEIEVPDSETEKLMTVQSIIDKVFAEKPEFVGNLKMD